MTLGKVPGRRMGATEAYAPNAHYPAPYQCCQVENLGIF